MPAARAALALEPLLPKAHAILAMSEPDPETEAPNCCSGITPEPAPSLRCRDLCSSKRPTKGDYAGTITTARSNPPRAPRTASRVFSPLLVDALAQKEPKQAFFHNYANAMISLGGKHFFGFAVNEPRNSG